MNLPKRLLVLALPIPALALLMSWSGQLARPAVAEPASAAPMFAPPPDSAIPNDDFGRVVREGQQIFNDTAHHAAPFVGNDLRCANCHLDAGRQAHAAPLWAGYVSYPAYRAKTGHVGSFAERLQDCFRYSMNGAAPPLGDPVLVALESYAFFLARGAPTGVTMDGRGYPHPTKPAAPDYARGEAVFAQNCAACHGADGAGQMADGVPVFPALWGARSFNWGAGMAVVSSAAGFIKANMPLGQPGLLSDQQAWDVALFVDSHERPQDPRFHDSVSQTRASFHNTPDSMYGLTVHGAVLGEAAPPFGMQPKP